jgi:AcrR family transcriptional regulator
VGRPSVAPVRREQILDALEAVVAENGLAGATLQRIADRAGITRSAIGHFIGNRDDVIDAAAARSVERIRTRFEADLDPVPAGDRPDAFIHVVFGRSLEERQTVLELNDELVALAHRNPYARQRLSELYGSLEELLRGILADAYPDADGEQLATVALTVALLLREADRVSVLGLTDHPELVRTRATRAVRTLFDSLGADAGTV